MSLDEIQKTTL
jgi:hypothetical protein